MDRKNIAELLSKTDYSEKAYDLFMQGLNCSQAVFVAFCDLIGIDEVTAKKLSVGLGGGVGRMREVCGAVSGAAMVLGYVFGGEDGTDKTQAYKVIKQFGEMFKERNGSVVCRELRGLDKSLKEGYVPDERTEEYYKVRPCKSLVKDAAEMVVEILRDEAKE